MSRKEKLLKKLCSKPHPKDFEWRELISLMHYHGFKESCRSGGSHYVFEHENGFRFRASKTHPEGILKAYQIRDVINALEHIGVLPWKN